MSSIQVRPLREDLPFGARIGGVNEATLKDEAVRRQINQVFEERGVIVFEGVEPSGQMQLAISDVFGPLKEHPIKVVARVNSDTMPGVIQTSSADKSKATIVELDGKPLISWLPWHFDHCYNNELNRAGVLRAIHIAPEGGLTGFADGIQLYGAIDPELRRSIEGHNILYRFEPDSEIRFSKPKNLRILHSDPSDVHAIAKTLSRAVHPAVWTRKSGEKVLHVSPWMSVGIEGKEDAEGNQLLEAVCQQIWSKAQPYFHQWSPTDMLIWDNWRMIHCVSGCDPKYPRLMHRTTIRGDYGLGYFEKGGKGHAVLETTV
jgi:taurine dioxygenase